jgi:hypothetical protein
MNFAKRIKGLIIDPDAEWVMIEAEDKSVAELYRGYIVWLALIPPFASFLGGHLFGYGRGPTDVEHLSLGGGLARALFQYLLSLPLLYLVAFVISSLAPHFDGKADDRRALALVAYSYTPAWLASIFGLVPGLRWLDILGFYGVYVFYHGLPRMMKCPKDHADVLTFVILILTVATGALHGWIVHSFAPWRGF